MNFKLNLFRKKLQGGVTIVELLVALTVSVIVLSMAINIYLSYKKNYQKTKTIAQNDVKVLNVQKLLYDAIEKAGLSCKYGTQTQQYINRTTDNLNDLSFLANKSRVRFGDVANIASYIRYTLPADIKEGIVYQSNTDYIMVKKEYLSAALESKPTSYTILTDKLLNVTKNDYLAICNNDQIDIVKATATIDNQIKLAAAPLSEYNRNDYVGKVGVDIYYIADTGKRDKLDNTIYGLFLYTKKGSELATSQLLIDGVSDLKVSYADTYRQKMHWKYIYKNKNINDIDSKALRVTFKIKGKKFEKVILLKG